jgi:hypothetical protein
MLNLNNMLSLLCTISQIPWFAQCFLPAIASSSGTFSSVWQSADIYTYRVTFNEIVDLGGIGAEGDSTRGTQDYLNRDNTEVSVDSLVRLFFNQIFIPDLTNLNVLRTGNRFWVLANKILSLCVNRNTQIRSISLMNHPSHLSCRRRD